MRSDFARGTCNHVACNESHGAREPTDNHSRAQRARELRRDRLWATLASTNDGVDVKMAVEGDAVSGDHPTRIHTGMRENLDPNPTFPLTTFVLDPLSSDGVSETSVAALSLEELLSSDYVILVHKSSDELTTYFVCGDIKTSNGIPTPGPGAAGSAGMANTGTSGANESARNSSLLVWGSVVSALALAATTFLPCRGTAHA